MMGPGSARKPIWARSTLGKPAEGPLDLLKIWRLDVGKVMLDPETLDIHRGLGLLDGLLTKDFPPMVRKLVQTLLRIR
eukprot:4663264-Pyramimonas_sp.AAC.1